MIECLLNYSAGTLSRQFTCGLFYKDSSGAMEDTDPDGDNKGLEKRAAFSARSGIFDLIGPIHSDIFFQERLTLNGVDAKIKMVRNKDEFCLMSEDAEQYSLKIVSASLFVKKVSVSTAVKLGHASALLTANAKYPIERVCMKTFSVAAGSRVCAQENLFLGQLPKTVVIGLVDNMGFMGAYDRNPFNFQHYDAEFVALYVDGQQFPAKPDFNRGNIAREYYSLVLATGRHLKNDPVAVDRNEYISGYTLYAFNLSPDEGCNQHLSMVKSGNMRLEMRFCQPLTRTVTLIVYATFDNIIEINQRRNILYDYY
ncbi:uncharacterized protein F54H12.2 [Paramormyrops kingsleyae]|uniref:uncharacterized protein F54H12.2 n=1 Tax=Paramormyrops kingsleyae TaxID=1676925 RepID=UPI003B971C83